MPNQPSQAIVLCEDIQQRVFIRRFLRGVGYSTHSIRERPIPNGRGSGEAHVKAFFPAEVKACRSRHSRASTVLIVVIDVDMQAVAERKNELVKLLAASNVPPLMPDEPITIFLPKRNIETWIKALNGDMVDEVTVYEKFPRNETQCWPVVDRLVQRVKSHEGAADVWPSSLQAAYDNFVRLWKE